MKNIDCGRCGCTIMNDINGCVVEYEIVSGRVWTPGNEPKRGKLVLWLSHPPSSFSAPIMVTSSSQVSDKMKNEECGMDEFLKMADKC